MRFAAKNEARMGSHPKIPAIGVPILAERLGVGIGMAYRVLAGMRKKGMVERDRRRGVWMVGNEAE